MLLTTIVVLVCLANILLGLLVLQRRPRRADSRWFFAMTCFIALWGLSAYFTDNSSPIEINLWLVRTSYLWASLTLLSFLLFSINLIYDKKSLVYRKKLALFLGGLPFALLALTPWVVPYVVSAEHGGVDEGIGVLKLPFLLFLLTLIVGIFIILRKYIKANATPAQVRAQARLVLFGIILSFTFGFTLNAILPFMTGSFATARFGGLTITFLAVFVAIGMIKHRLFDIRLVVARSLAYILSLLILGLLYVVITFGLTGALFEGRQPSTEQQTIYIVLALLLALSFSPLKKRFDVLTRHIFYRDGYDTQEILDAVSNTLVKTVSLPDMGQRVIADINKAFKPVYTAIVVQSEEVTGPEAVIASNSFNKKTIDIAVSAISRTKKMMIVADELDRDSKLVHQLNDARIAVIVRLRSSKEAVGYLILGYKNSGNIYSTQDVNLIRIISDELAVAVQNSLRFEEIRNFNETLQDKVDAATHRLQRANTRLRQLDATKDEFVSMASHQLRTPLTSVKGYLSMVLEGDAGKLNPAQEKLLKEAFTSSERMVRLIGDFLNVSRLRTGKFVIEKHAVNMADLVEAEVSQLASTAKTRELDLTYEKPADLPEIQIDKGKIQQVIMNLIDNAIFYSKPKGKITVELFKKKNEIVLRVKDSGIGVPAQEKKRLFTKFYRASNARKQRPDGTGIGLFMAQKVVIAHGGSMIFESTEGKGSTFGFRLPIVLSKEDEARAATVTEKSIIE